jgi:DNA-binding NtrC family response regulator
MTEAIEVLLLDDEPIVGRRLQPSLVKDGYRVEIFTDSQEALNRLREKEFDIVVTDIRMNEVDGLEILEQVKARSPRTQVILITGYATIELAREALAKGAFDFLAKPSNPAS